MNDLNLGSLFGGDPGPEQDQSMPSSCMQMINMIISRLELISTTQTTIIETLTLMQKRIDTLEDERRAYQALDSLN